MQEVRVRPESLFNASEAFLTNTSARVWPIAAVDGQAIGLEVPGHVTRGLTDRFDRIIAGEDPQFLHWLTFVGEEKARSKNKSAVQTALSQE